MLFTNAARRVESEELGDGVGAVVPLDGCGIATAVPGAPPGVSPEADTTVTDRTISTLRSRLERSSNS